MSNTETHSLLLVNDLPNDIYQKLTVMANQHHRSLAQEIIAILIDNLCVAATPLQTTLNEEGIGTCLHRRFAQLADNDLELPLRSTARYIDFSINN